MQDEDLTPAKRSTRGARQQKPPTRQRATRPQHSRQTAPARRATPTQSRRKAAPTSSRRPPATATRANQQPPRALPKKRSKAPLVVLGVLVVVALLVGGTFLVTSLFRRGGEDSGSPTITPVVNDQLADPEDEDQNEQGSATQAEPVRMEVMMIGDLLMHDAVVNSGYQADGTYNYDFVFDHIKPYIDDADLRILNQETVMGYPENGYVLYMGAAGPIMNTPTALADSEMNFGFNVILKATNHTFDQGFDGLGHELDYWKEHYPNVPVTGVNNPHAAEGDDSQDLVNNVYVFEKDGFKVAILNHTYGTNENPDYALDPTYVSYLSEEKVRADVQKARDAGADMIIACPHWGIEYQTTPSNEEYTYSKLYTELGVDVIFGCHPHILQPVEMLRNEEGHQTVCFYSMGNYVADIMPASSLIGGVARTTLVKDADGSCHVEAASLVPTVICRTYGPNMTAFPIYDYTYDLTAQSSMPDLTPDFAYSFCSGVLGEGFDTNTGVFTLNMQDEGRLV